MFQLPLSAASKVIHAAHGLLSPDEMERAARFYFERDRNRFTLSRAALRRILAGFLDASPRDLVFSYNEYGKPRLASPRVKAGFEFNISHSCEYAMVAVARDLRVGVDVEFINAETATEDLAAHCFSKYETQVLRMLPIHEKAEAFFRCWTRKEAYIKAIGKGVSLPLDSFDVAFAPGAPPGLLRASSAAGEDALWSMYEVSAPPGYAAALVAEGTQHRLTQECIIPGYESRSGFLLSLPEVVRGSECTNSTE